MIQSNNSILNLTIKPVIQELELTSIAQLTQNSMVHTSYSYWRFAFKGFKHLHLVTSTTFAADILISSRDYIKITTFNFEIKFCLSFTLVLVFIELIM